MKQEENRIISSVKPPETLGIKVLSSIQDKLGKALIGSKQESRIIKRIKSYMKIGYQSKDNKFDKKSPIDVNSQISSDWEDGQETGLKFRSFSLSTKILDTFSRWLKIKLPSVRIHQNDETNKYLKNRQADAMTIGSDIYFKTDKFNLKDAQGLGLLGHELTHVAQQNSSDWRDPNLKNSSENSESSAIDNERMVLRNSQVLKQDRIFFSSPESVTNVSSNSKQTSVIENQKPMFADVSRNINEVPGAALLEMNAATISDGEMQRIKDEVYRDLMMRLKVEFERGA